MSGAGPGEGVSIAAAVLDCGLLDLMVSGTGTRGRWEKRLIPVPHSPGPPAPGRGEA